MFFSLIAAFAMLMADPTTAATDAAADAAAEAADAAAAAADMCDAASDDACAVASTDDYPGTDYIDAEAGDLPCDDACTAAAEAAAAIMASDTDGDGVIFVPTEGDIWGAMEAMSPGRRGELRCAMLGELVFHEYKRGASAKNYDLTGEKTEILAGAVAEAIMAEQGIPEELVRAMFKQDFEDFTGQMLRDGQPPAVAETTLNDAMQTCAPLYASIKVEGNREGTVGGLAPLNIPPVADTKIDAPYCYALFSAFADAAKARAGRETRESTAFDDKASRIQTRMVAESGNRAAVIAATVTAVAKFDIAAFDAMNERDAENVITACDSIAGPDA